MPAFTILSPPFFCGEAPLWIEEKNQFVWVDTRNPVCCRLTQSRDNPDQETSPEIVTTEGQFQCLGMNARGGFIAPLPDRIVLTDNDLKITRTVGSPIAEKPYMGLNDGTCGPDGCFYFGAIHTEDLYSKEGGVFRVNRDLSIEQVIGNLALPNGMCFSPDGTLLYVTEMFGNRIWRHTFDKENGPSEQGEIFAEIPEENGHPDGLICDADGYLYSAHWQGFRITRYTPEGRIDTETAVPVPTPTCMAFGGPGMSDLLITTAQLGLSEEQLAGYPDSGKTYLMQTEYTGKTEYLFDPVES